MLFGVDPAGNIAGYIGTAVLGILRMVILYSREKCMAAAKAYNRRASCPRIPGGWRPGRRMRRVTLCRRALDGC